jgi:DNA mismatch endonuclease (patch repair protein)
MTRKRTPLPDSAWKPGETTPNERKREQDTAAGGREARRVLLASGRVACGSICLKHFRKSCYRVYAYLRYSVGGRTIVKYVGDVTSRTRNGALRRGWKLASVKRLLVDPDH